MTADARHSYTAFQGSRRLAAGALEQVAVAAARASAAGQAPVLVFSDATGEQVDLDFSGGEQRVRERYARAAQAPAPGPAPRGRGRPRLGVVAREVTLLPEHWDWLASQPGGASVTLRKLVHHALRAAASRDRVRQARERSYKFMAAIAGDRPAFEEAARALFAGDLPALGSTVERWPRDIREHVLQLADPDRDEHSRKTQ